MKLPGLEIKDLYFVEVVKQLILNPQNNLDINVSNLNEYTY